MSHCQMCKQLILLYIIIKPKNQISRKRLEKDRRFLQHIEFLEEVYISASKSPIFKEDGTIWAVLSVCDFTTYKVLAERRIKTLSDLANHTNDANSLESACHIIMKSFRENDKDIPFALIYLIDGDKLRAGFQPRAARLISTTFNYKDLYNKNWDIPDNLLETPKTINLIENPDENYDLFIEVKRPTTNHLFLKCKSWPVHFVVKEEKDIKILLKDGSQAMLFPIKASYSGELILSSILICGINPSRELDNDYTNFLRSVVTYVSTTITNGKLREEERKQVEMLANLNQQKLKFFHNTSRELLSNAQLSQNTCYYKSLNIINLHSTFIAPLTLTLSPLDEAINLCMQETIKHLHLQIVQRNTHRLLKLFSNIESGLDYIIDIPDSENFKQALENEVYLDHMFETIIYNLCSNAFKNTWSGQIKACLYIENKNTVILEVSDTCVGIPEDDLTNIFQQLITYHGGEISVISKVGQGTTFKCQFLAGFKHLPKNQVYFNKKNNELNQERHLYTKKQLYLEEGLQWIQRNKSINKNFMLNPGSIDDSDNVDNSKISSNMTKKHKILLVEDNSDMRNHLEELLRKEFEVYSVYNGYDAIIFNTTTRLIPFVLLTARADENLELDYGADDYLVKPFNSRELIAQEIKQLLTSISSNILSGLDLEEILSEVIKDIYQILPCDRIFAISYEPSEFKNYTIIALSEDSKAISDIKLGQLEAIVNQLESSDYESKEFKIEILPSTYFANICKQVSMLSVMIKIHDKPWAGIKAHRSPNTKEKILSESRIKFIRATDNIKNMILSNMSHELRTPLGTVMSICSSFENEVLTEYQSASVNRVFDLLDLSENAIEIFGEKAGNKQIELALNYNSDTLPKYVKSVLIKFTEKGEVIMKVLKSSSDESVKDKNFIKLLIILSDTVDKLKILQQYGTGFGLLTCKQLVEINGSEIEIESQLGKGSKFWFTWNVEIVQASYTQKTSNYYNNSSKILFDRLTNHSLKRILLIHPFKNIRDTITSCFKDCFNIDLFDKYNERIETAKYYKELYNRAPYCMIFINIDENTFSNSNERSLVKKLIKKIREKITCIFKPITPKKLLSHYFQNNIAKIL
ncbi:hypothetical protein C2G38_2217926 [Gigaspora rosea]|uniref:Response regulatory domain-containing protein n=1 Tax=Gigaspora rosea TaxID=44941 RepID=A0A397U8S1_9GLOM|nr:hypothetical protein C2G38_2217926 [Gigaspora rosea]